MQKWWCERCHQHGSVRYETGAGVYAVRDLIQNSHAQSAQWCSEMWGMSYVRVVA